MNKPNIIYHEGIAIDISLVKSIKLVSKSVQDLQRVVIEFKTRYEYVFNPNKGVHEKEKIDDVTELTYDDFGIAQQIVKEFMEIWQDYLDENKGKSKE
ncbi:MAG: hypothetical protein NTU98_08135 [Bacteroidetes bacterium]|nr:hypothetical protein [Bacteroidota bacterium]